MYIKGLVDRLVCFFICDLFKVLTEPMTRPIQHFGSILERSTFPPTGCLASPSTHESVNTDQTRRSVFYLYRETYTRL